MNQRTVYRWFILFACLLIGLPGWAVPAAGAAPQLQAAAITEDFTNYAYRYENNWTDWNIWDGQLSLAKRSAWLREDMTAVMQADGSTFVGWEDTRGRARNLFLQKLDPSGNRLWQHDVAINDSVPANSRGPLALVLDGQGGVFAVFKDNRDLGGNNPYNQHLFAQHISATGQRLWSNDRMVGDSLNTGEQDFRAAAVPGGGLAVLWKEGDFASGDHFFLVQKFTAAGAGVFAQPVKVLGPGDLSYTLAASLVVFPQGAVLASWIVADSINGGVNSLWGQWVEPSGQLRAAAPVLLAGGAGEPGVGDAVLTGLPDGTAYVAWCASLVNGWQIYAQRIGADGARLWSAPVPADDQMNATLCVHLNAVLDNQENLLLWWKYYNSADPINIQRISKTGQRLIEPSRKVAVDSPYRSEIIQDKLAAVDATGDVLVLYALGPYLTGQSFTPDNTPRSPSPSMINELDGTADQFNPRAAAGTDGSTYIAWQSPRLDRMDLFLQRYSAAGKPLIAVARRLDMGLVTEIPGSASLAVDGQNNAVVAYEFNSGSRTEVRVQKFSPTGQALWPADKAVVAGSTAKQFQPSAGVDAAGDVYVAWAQEDNQVLMQKFSASGSRQWNTGKPVNVTQLPAGWKLQSRGHPALDVNAQGVVTVAWAQYGLEPIGPDSWKNHNRIYAQRFSTSGAPQWQADLQVNAPDDNLYYPLNLVLDLDPSGGAYVLVDFEGSYEYETNIQRITPNGARAWATDIRFSPPTNPTHGAHLAATSDSNALITWVKMRTNPHIAASKLSPAGTLVWQEEKWINDIPLSQPGNPWVTAFPDGTATIAYQYMNVNANANVYFSRINSAGTRVLGTTPVITPELLYQPSGQAQSLRLNPASMTIQSATLSADFALNGGSIQFFLSNNGGKSWEAATPGAPHVFAAVGQDLRWRVVLQASPGWMASPVIRSLSVSINGSSMELLNPVYLPFLGR